MNQSYICLLIFILGGLFGGCSFNFEVTSQKTALENQVMGTYKKLDDDLILYSSVRGTSNKSPSLSKAEQDVLLARQTQIFNQDDIDEYKRGGLVGESHEGILVFLPGKIRSKVKTIPFDRDLAEEIVKEENQNRQDIWRYTIRKSRILTNQDLGKIKNNYAQLAVSRSPSGTWFQRADGSWIQKK